MSSHQEDPVLQQKKKRASRTLYVELFVIFVLYLISIAGSYFLLEKNAPATKELAVMNFVLAVLFMLLRWRINDAYETTGDKIEKSLKDVNVKVDDLVRNHFPRIEERLQLLKADIDISDADFYRVLKKIERKFTEILKDARVKSIRLHLDDLFDLVTELISNAKEISAVDLEVDRWVNDERARKYFDANREALARGALIRRVYIISPKVRMEDFNALISVVKEHRNLNDQPGITGKIEAGVVHYTEIAPHLYQDFAIFVDGETPDDVKVLYEEFVNWQSQFTGGFTKKDVDIKKYTRLFEDCWQASLPSRRNLDEWVKKTEVQLQNGRYPVSG